MTDVGQCISTKENQLSCVKEPFYINFSCRIRHMLVVQVANSLL